MDRSLGCHEIPTIQWGGLWGLELPFSSISRYLWASKCQLMIGCFGYDFFVLKQIYGSCGSNLPCFQKTNRNGTIFPYKSPKIFNQPCLFSWDALWYVCCGWNKMARYLVKHLIAEHWWTPYIWLDVYKAGIFQRVLFEPEGMVFFGTPNIIHSFNTPKGRSSCFFCLSYHQIDLEKRHRLICRMQI